MSMHLSHHKAVAVLQQQKYFTTCRNISQHFEIFHYILDNKTWKRSCTHMHVTSYTDAHVHAECS